MKQRILFPLLVGLMLAMPAAGAAQGVLQGTFTRAAGGSPIEGATVVLLTESGRQQEVNFTDAAGRFLFVAVPAGRYRMRAERVGFLSTVSPVLEVAAGETREVSLVSREQTVQLQGISVRGRRRCTIRPEQGRQTAQVWEETRKALAAAAATGGQDRYRFEAVLAVRERHPRDLRIRRETVAHHAATGANPFPSLAAAELAEHGYVQSKGDEAYYYAPDAQVLLSDLFLEQHCFELRAGADDEQGMIGLAFRPARKGKLPDVEGVLWLDPATNELRHLEYRYTGLNLPVRTTAPGGRLEFRRLPSGGWIVQRWWIRMPVVELQETAGDRVESFADLGISRSSLGPRSGSGAVLHSIREQGGEITRVLRPDGTPVYVAHLATIQGSVLDSTTMAPLAGATVSLLGTDARTTTDSLGRFRLEGVRNGVYTLGFTHPRLDSLGLTPPTRSVHVADDAALQIDLAGPSLAAGYASTPLEVRLDDHQPVRVDLALAPVTPPVDQTADAGVAGFFGLVLDDATGKPLRNVEVVFPEHGMSTRTLENGRFALTDVPAGIRIAELRLPGYPTQRLRVDLPAGRAVEETFRMRFDAVALEEISVQGRRSTVFSPQLAGFYERAAKGRGRFVTRDQIEAQAPHRISDVLRQVPGLYLYRNAGGEWEVRSSRAQGSPAMKECPLRFFLDGMPYTMTENVDRLVQPHHVEGIEIYSGTQLPAQYAGSKSGCGVIAIWTREVVGDNP